ncbi:MAG: TAXI family TRAP transporter solute-binding subunit, partial [Deltaproteobacteria bacterium]|nr:TAXI family TRAP transporter solute-binding subunit [Deltaproteobacteria bacterium]
MTGKMYCFKFKWILISMIALTLMVGGTPGEADAARKFVRFGGSNPGGSWFVIAGGLSAFLSEQISDLNVTAIATGGSVDNNRQARKENLDVWLTHALTAYDNWNGVGVFKDEKPFKSIRMLSGVYENHHHFVALEKSGIKTMSDLKGKKVVLGSAGSGGAVNSE